MVKMRPAWFIVPFLIFSFTGNVITGKVIGIKDGDTIEVLVDRTKVKVRLFGVDAPELNQDFGQKAKQFTSQLCFGKEVKIISKGKDHFGRTLGEVILPDGRNLNHELVKQGMAWHFKKYSSSKLLENLEVKARARKRGLWSQPNPVPPWDFRKSRKKKSSAGGK